jgi:hypothetical protein
MWPSDVQSISLRVEKQSEGGAGGKPGASLEASREQWQTERDSQRTEATKKGEKPGAESTLNHEDDPDAAFGDDDAGEGNAEAESALVA